MKWVEIGGKPDPHDSSAAQVAVRLSAFRMAREQRHMTSRPVIRFEDPRSHTGGGGV